MNSEAHFAWIRRLAHRVADVPGVTPATEAQTSDRLFLPPTQQHLHFLFSEHSQEATLHNKAEFSFQALKRLRSAVLETEPSTAESLAMQVVEPWRQTDRQAGREPSLTHQLRSLTQIWSLILFSFLNTVFTLKSIPTVLTKADVKESSA